MSVAATIQAFEKVVDTVLDELVVYRPTFGKLTGSVTAGILLERIRYYAKGKNYEEFYKFNSICTHKDYRKGDSWEEELGFTRFEFEGARNRIATKVAKGDSKKELLKVFDESGELMPVNNIVLYWRDSSNKIWYQFNEPLFMAHLLKNTNAEIPNAEIQHYLEMRKSPIPYVMRESLATLSTESLSENTTKKKEKESLSIDKAVFSGNQPSAILVEEKASIKEAIAHTYQLPQFMKLALLTALAHKSKAVEQAEAHIAALETDTVPDVLPGNTDTVSEKTPKQIQDEYQEIIRRVFGEWKDEKSPPEILQAGFLTTNLMKFFRGMHKSGKESLEYQLETPWGIAKIAALYAYYRRTYTGQKRVPRTFKVLREKCDEFDALPIERQQRYLDEGQRLVERVLGGSEVMTGQKQPNDYDYTNPAPPPIIEKMSPEEADALFAELDSI